MLEPPAASLSAVDGPAFVGQGATPPTGRDLSLSFSTASRSFSSSRSKICVATQQRNAEKQRRLVDAFRMAPTRRRRRAISLTSSSTDRFASEGVSTMTALHDTIKHEQQDTQACLSVEVLNKPDRGLRRLPRSYHRYREHGLSLNSLVQQIWAYSLAEGPRKSHYTHMLDVLPVQVPDDMNQDAADWLRSRNGPNNSCNRHQGGESGRPPPSSWNWWTTMAFFDAGLMLLLVGLLQL